MKRIHNQMMEQDMLTLLLRDLVELKQHENKRGKLSRLPLARGKLERIIKRKRERVDALMDEIVEYKLQGAIASDAGVYREWQRLRGKVD